MKVALKRRLRRGYLPGARMAIFVRDTARISLKCAGFQHRFERRYDRKQAGDDNDDTINENDKQAVLRRISAAPTCSSSGVRCPNISRSSKMPISNAATMIWQFNHQAGDAVNDASWAVV